MDENVGSYPVAWRLVALCALWLLWVPTSLAQDRLSINPTFHPRGGWDALPVGHVSEGSSDNYYAQFSVDSSLWGKLEIAVLVRPDRGNPGLATLYLDSRPVANLEADPGGVEFDMPPVNHIYNVTLKAQPGSPDSRIYVYQIFAVRRVARPTTQEPSQRLGVSTPRNPTSTLTTTTSTQTGIISSSGTTSVESSSLASIPTTIASGSPYPTGLLSPPVYTNPPTSISDAPLVSSGSESQGINSVAVVGVVFGVLIGICTCIFGAVFYRRRRGRNRVAPSTAFMNYRSTTEQPPAYPFSRTSFFRRSKPDMAGLGGMRDTKGVSPHLFAPGIAGLGYGAIAGAGRRRLMTVDEKTAEGRESAMGSSALAPSYEDPRSIVLPSQSQGEMGGGAGYYNAGILGVSGGGGYVPAASRGLSIDGVARTLSSPLSSTSDKPASTPSMDENPYDGLALPEPAANSSADPFRTPPADDNNMASRGAWVVYSARA